ncbi:MAG: amidohydrolase family protein [Gemmatimonadetes bacterium]|nr:amidohydrolase family protein [Gemmatimonadota bacterium]
MRRLLFAALLLSGAIFASHLAAQERQSLDLLITGGHLLDGTGNPWIYADVGIRGGKIVAVGRLTGSQATRVIDARGKVVTPGFIDLHSHGGERLGSTDARRRAAPNVVTQGVTTVVINPDGRGPVGIGAQRSHLQSQRIGPNAIVMVGHNTVRGEVMGEDHRRLARPEEVPRMRALVRAGMEHGAFGLSAGLEYVPGRWSDTDEVVALVEEIVPFGGLFIEHERSSGTSPMGWRPSQDEPGRPTMLNSVQETIEIGERTGATVVATTSRREGRTTGGRAAPSSRRSSGHERGEWRSSRISIPAPRAGVTAASA